jgi:phospholipase C
MTYPIKHLVVLMLENRSFDHMLGFLPSTPGHPINGLTGDEKNPLSDEGPSVRVSRDARTVHDLIPDPGHEFLNVNVQIFRNQDGTGPAIMKGFVIDYGIVGHDNGQAPNVMKCFTPQTLPVLSKLAQEYAVCDRWFSSVPGSTIPNRLFTHAAHSGGSLTQDVIAAPLRIRTIFQDMDVAPNPHTYRIYTHGSSVLMANIYLQSRQQRFSPFSDFAEDAAKGDLPAYTFIEPAYDDNLNHGIYANSQHPDFPVDEGERLIATVYDALRVSPGWNDTLLVITYDEHGGIFDHVPPPAVTPTVANKALPDVPNSNSPAFDFRRLGVRVPTVLVSPRIDRNTVVNDHDYEHCSIVATVRKLFCGRRAQRPFNWREAQAPSLANLLVLDNPRADVVLPTPVAADPPTNVEVEAAMAAFQAHSTIALNAAAATPDGGLVIQAAALPKQPPAVRKPTDLMLAMAKSIDLSMKKQGTKPTKDINTIYSAQDAVDFVAAASKTLGF